MEGGEGEIVRFLIFPPPLIFVSIHIFGRNYTLCTFMEKNPIAPYSLLLYLPLCIFHKGVATNNLFKKDI